MKPPFPLYVDKIGPNGIKATVSTSTRVAYNLRMVLFISNPFYAHAFPGQKDNLGEEINGICIVPVGKFICMLVKKENSMIFLDLTDKEGLAEIMAERLNHVDLQDRFMQVYNEIIENPRGHNRFELVIGEPEGNI